LTLGMPDDKLFLIAVHVANGKSRVYLLEMFVNAIRWIMICI
jgi:hypothetical protein